MFAKSCLTMRLIMIVLVVFNCTTKLRSFRVQPPDDQMLRVQKRIKSMKGESPSLLQVTESSGEQATLEPWKAIAATCLLTANLSPSLGFSHGLAMKQRGAASLRVIDQLRRSPAVQANLFGDLFDDSKLKTQNPPDRPLLPALVKSEAASYVLQEKLLSLSGEDFRVRDIHGEEVIQIDGGNINIGGWVMDKLAFKTHEGDKFCSVERRALATTTCYDIYNLEGECVAKVDREMFSMAPEYKFFYEGDMNPFPDFVAKGTFSERKYTLKNGLGETIARVSRSEEAFNNVDTYQVEVAAGVDAAAVIACAVIIDEDHDEGNV